MSSGELFKWATRQTSVACDSFAGLTMNWYDIALNWDNNNSDFFLPLFFRDRNLLDE